MALNRDLGENIVRIIYDGRKRIVQLGFGLRSGKVVKLRNATLFLVLSLVGSGCVCSFYNRCDRQDEDGIFYSSSFIQDATNTPVKTYNLHARKLILLWNYGRQSVEEIRRTARCTNLKHCTITSDKRKITSADAIYFEWRPGMKFTSIKRKNSKQVWVFGQARPHNGSRTRQNSFKGSFDLTMTYRKKSDIYNPVGVFTFNENYLDLEDENLFMRFISRKQKLMAYCGNSYSRNAVTRRMAEMIVKEFTRMALPVDQLSIYPTVNYDSKDSFFKQLSNVYKFYLILDFDVCEDYVPEDIFFSLKYGIVPVVLEGTHLKPLLPNKSFVDMMDFTSMQHLVTYLEMLNQKDRLYRKFFLWSLFYDVEVPSQRGLCHLCEELNRLGHRKDNSGTQSEYLFGEMPQCKELSQKYKLSNFGVYDQEF